MRSIKRGGSVTWILQSRHSCFQLPNTCHKVRRSGHRRSYATAQGIAEYPSSERHKQRHSIQGDLPYQRKPGPWTQFSSSSCGGFVVVCACFSINWKERSALTYEREEWDRRNWHTLKCVVPPGNVLHFSSVCAYQFLKSLLLCIPVQLQVHAFMVLKGCFACLFVFLMELLLPETT